MVIPWFDSVGVGGFGRVEVSIDQFVRVYHWLCQCRVDAVFGTGNASGTRFRDRLESQAIVRGSLTLAGGGTDNLRLYEAASNASIKNDSPALFVGLPQAIPRRGEA